MRKSFMVMAALAAGLMIGGCRHDHDDSDDRRPTRQERTGTASSGAPSDSAAAAQAGTTAGPDRGTRGGSTSGTGTGTGPGTGA